MSETQKQAVPEVAVPIAANIPAAATEAPARQALVKTPRRRAPSVDQVAAQHQKVLAEALTKAAPAAAKKPAAKPAALEKPVKVKPVKTEKPATVEKLAKPEKAGKAAKAPKPIKEKKPPKLRKPKLVRDSYAMPEAEYARIAELKKRLAALGSEVKKSELLRGGVAVLAALNDAELKAVMGRVERIKTGRPAKR